MTELYPGVWMARVKRMVVGRRGCGLRGGRLMVNETSRLLKTREDVSLLVLGMGIWVV